MRAISTFTAISFASETYGRVAAAALLASIAVCTTAAAQTAPPAPVLVAPANGASLVQPITLQWNAIVDPDGPIGSYSWEVSTTSTFGAVIASGFNNFDNEVPLPTIAQVSGLANGTYFWRVKGAQDQGPAGFFDSPFSAPRSFTVTGLGPAPGIPVVTAPSSTQFHPFEFFDIVWTEVPGAQYYLLEADDDAAFSHPISLSQGPTIVFGTRFEAGWGNALTAHYRVRAVSVDNVWGRPSATLTVQITNAAPVPPAPTPLAPVGGAAITIPFKFDWTDTANPQDVGYDIDIDDEPNFQGAVGVMMILQVSRSDYMIVGDPLVEGINHLPPGQYFWRVRAIHGSVFGPWSSGASFRVTASPSTPTGLQLFWILSDPGTVYGGNSGAARLALNMPAPAGGALIHIASDIPGVEVPGSTVTIPAGETDVVVPVTSQPRSPGIVGTLRAAYAGKWDQNSLGSSEILWGGDLSAESVVGGTTVTGTVALLGPAPAGGLEVRLVSSKTALALPPASVFIPAGATGATFDITTSAVTVPTRVEFKYGSPLEAYRSPGGTSLVLRPAGSPAPAPALATLTHPSSMLGGGTVTGTVTLTAPAPAGGAQIRINGSSAGTIDVIVPAGSLSANFTITQGPVVRTQYVLMQASYWPFGQQHARTLRVDPGTPGPAPMFALGAVPHLFTGGDPCLGTVGLAVPAPPGGQVVTLSSSAPSLAQVPATVTVPAGHSTASFNITTSPAGGSAEITATSAGVSKSNFIYFGPAAGTLSSLTLNPTTVAGGSSSTGTATLATAAPAGGATVSLSSSNTTVASVPASVTVAAGATSATFPVTTFAVSSTTGVTITATAGGATRTANLSVAPPAPAAPSLLSPANLATVAQPIPFDWTDAANAATYEIQIDTASNFAAPLTLSQTVGASTATISGLPAQQLWWRVRGTNAAGVNGPFSASRRFTAQAAPPAASLSAVSVSPTSVVGGNGATGTVTLTSAAPTGGLLVNLADNSSAATVPASVTVASGATTATFAVTTTSVATSTAVTITATQGANTRTTTLTVTPVPPPASLSAVSVNPTSVTGGSNSTGTVTLTSAAPAGGLLVNLSSSNATVASVPASVTVASGATTASFTVTTTTVASATSVTLTATQGANTRTVMLTVNPVATGPLPAPTLVSPAIDARFSPGQNITFDWSDVSGAASYTLQIDNNQTIAAPFVLEQTVTASTFSTSTLPTQTMWWRVRANDSAGNPGNWSSVRRFEVKN